MNETLARVAPGWTVASADGEEIGTVSEVREDHLVVEQNGLTGTTLYVPVDHVGRTTDDGSDHPRVAITVPASEVDAQGWRFPPNAGIEREKPVEPEVPATTMIQTAGMSAGRLSAPEPQGVVRDSHTTDEQLGLPRADLGPDDEVPEEDLSEAGR